MNISDCNTPDSTSCETVLVSVQIIQTHNPSSHNTDNNSEQKINNYATSFGPEACPLFFSGWFSQRFRHPPVQSWSLNVFRINGTNTYRHKSFDLKFIKRMWYIPLYLMLRPLMFFRKTDSTFLWDGVSTVCLTNDGWLTNESVNWSATSNVVNIVTVVQETIPNSLWIKSENSLSFPFSLNLWLLAHFESVPVIPEAICISLVCHHEFA